MNVMVETIIKLAGVPVRFRCFSEKAARFLRRYQPQSGTQEQEADFTIDAGEMLSGRPELEKILKNPLQEYSYLIEPASDALMTVDRCCLHGVAYVWGERAWILSAPSGTGKSTQYRNLTTLYGEEISCINGDKPCLEFRSDGTIMVHDSPWRGKEGWGTAEAVFPLTGMFFLYQKDYNEMQEYPRNAGIIPLYHQIFSSRKTEKELRNICRLEDILLRNIPVRFLANRGDPDSTRLIYEAMEWILTTDASQN